MSLNSPLDENEYSHRQGSITSIPDEEDQITVATDSVKAMKVLELSSQHHLSSSKEDTKVPHLDDAQALKVENEYQIATIDLQSIPDTSIDENVEENWKHSPIDKSIINEAFYQPVSRSETSDDITVSFGFQHQDQRDTHNQTNERPLEEINSGIDYETFVRSRNLYFDPNPELIQRPQKVAPLVYKQNIKIKFLKPPPVPQGPLIIREVRPPQPPPPPPLVIRQRPVPPVSLPPIVLREKPPEIPKVIKTQVVTKTLPPTPLPPRSVIVEKIPPLPSKPRDIIIERWIPYESLVQKRQVIIQPAEKPKPYPPPKNIIIKYDPIPAQVVRQFDRVGIVPEDPQNYLSRYGKTLLETSDLLAQARELGITEDISPPRLLEFDLQKQLETNSFDNIKFEQSSANATVSSSNITEKSMYSDIDNTTYAATYENLLDESLSSMNINEWNEQTIDQDINEEDLYAQLAQYGLTKDSIPY